ncbi:hypothetical protein HanXRQr2_Chr13g0572511 [Helianthus annuus]|uniref:Uncharacterized protein n=1 Tax=Helianthus annuus TaxID=4232 RepID=A0A251SQV0_HELAN|nr:hypothetical protein HanXRQr2_Chr13g0572511 [Helianthus annuus]
MILKSYLYSDVLQITLILKMKGRCKRGQTILSCTPPRDHSTLFLTLNIFLFLWGENLTPPLQPFTAPPLPLSPPPSLPSQILCIFRR